MKKLLLSTITFAAVAGAGAITGTGTGIGVQTASAQTGPNQMSIRVAGYEVQLKGEETRRDRTNSWRRNNYYGGRIGFLEVGFNDFRTWDDTYAAYLPEERDFMELDRARSIHATVNVATFSTGLARNWIGITMAIGMSYNLYTFDTPVAFEKIERRIYPWVPEHDLKRSKMQTVSLHVPLVLEINPTRNFFVSAGGYADVILYSEMRWKSPKEKLTSPYTDFLQMGLTARVGFRDAYIFANYAVGDLFRTGRGPRLNPYTFGLGFGF